MLELKAAGLPNSDRLSASLSHNVQPLLSTFVRCSGGLFIDPRLEASVIEPFWKKARSPSSTITVSVLPPLSRVMPVTVICPSVVASSKSVARQSVSK